MFDESTAQVSMNLLDHRVTGLEDVTEAIREEASLLGLNAVAGELVGLVPLEAMLSAGRKYHSGPTDGDEMTLVHSAVSGLMLDALGKFDAKSSIIEWAIIEEE
jgi:glutamate formiminotransferase/formiminotetrahydrofolate cyclodeaminase